MKLFQMYKKLLPVFLGYNKKLEAHGFTAPNSIEKIFYYSTNICGYILITVSTIVTGGSLIYMASTLQEYTDNTIMFAALLNDALLFVSLRWRFESVLNLIESLEQMIEKRKQIKFKRNFKYIAVRKNCISKYIYTKL